MSFNPQKTLGVVDSLTKAAKGLICLGWTIFSFANPKNLLAGIGMLAVGIANSVANAVTAAVSDSLNEILATLSVPLLQLKGYVDSLLRSVNNLKKLYDKLSKKKFDLFNFLFDKQACAIQGANFMNCIFKAIMNKVDKKITSKLVNNVDGVLGKLQKQMKDEVLRSGGLLDKHVGSQINKFETITKKLNVLA